jgi:hypothetical protein
MNIKQLSEIAIKMGIKPTKLKKVELVRKIQRTEGNYDCFGTAYKGECDQLQCKWRSDCLPLSVKHTNNKGK